MIKQSKTNVRIRVIIERPKAPERTGKEGEERRGEGDREERERNPKVPIK